MKLTAIYDGEGRILAGIIDDGRYDMPRPVPDDKSQIGTFDIPTEAQGVALEEICTSFRVDPGAQQLTRNLVTQQLMGERRMKLTALYDGEGRILAGIIDDGRHDAPRPVPDDRSELGTFDIPTEAQEVSLEEICTTFKVDPGAKQLTRSKG